MEMLNAENKTEISRPAPAYFNNSINSIAVGAKLEQ